MAGKHFLACLDGFLRYSIRRTRSISCAHAILMSSSKLDDKTLVLSVATVVSTSLSNCTVGSKSGRRERALATTLCRPGLYSTEELNSAKNDNHLAMRCEKCGLFTAEGRGLSIVLNGEVRLKLTSKGDAPTSLL